MRRICAALAEERQQWQTEQEESLRGIDDKRQQLAARLAELEAERNALAAERNGLQVQQDALAEERRQWQTEQEQAKQGLDAHGEQVAARSTELEAGQNALAAARDLEAQRNILAEERRQWTTSQEETLRGIDERADNLLRD